MSESEKYGNVQQKMNEAISVALKDGGDFVLKWVSIVEVLDDEGDRALWAVTSEDIQSWDVLGMLQWGLQHEQAGKVVNLMIRSASEDEDDE